MSTRTLQLGHSPDPDDAFMFYALAQDPPLIETHGFRFRHVLQDIQTLNRRAMRGELEITAISIHAYPYVADKYALMSCGSSMGDGYGPMIVARQPMAIEQLRGKHVAIPGQLTTAFLAMQLCVGRGAERASDKSSPATGNPRRTTANAATTTGDFSYEVVMFDEIPRRVASGEFDAGLLIHEGQLTFRQLGLHLVVDLGAWWQQRTGLPLPLGGNVIRRDLGRDVCQAVTNVLRRSIQFSLDHRDAAVKYALRFGRDLDHALADRFVGMYVNHWTLDYGQRGRDAIDRLLGEGAAAGLVPPTPPIDYITAATRP